MELAFHYAPREIYRDSCIQIVGLLFFGLFSLSAFLGYNEDRFPMYAEKVLGADQILTPQDIVDRCSALPGLKACVLLQPHATLTSQGMDAEEAAAFRASAARTRDSLATLAETMGLGSSGNFTLRTDHGIRSFFLEANLCLAVWHAQPQFSGGTREKLILISQELAKSPLS